MSTGRLLLACATGAMALLSGCGLFWDDPYVRVTATPLNWCEIHYYNATREPIRRVNVRVDGSGHVLVKAGTARRVSDSFAKDLADANQGDCRVFEYNVDPDHVREVFQNLVNAGLFDKDKMFTSTKYPSPGRFIAVRAAMDNKTYSEPVNVFEEDPELAERLYNVVLEFNRPVLGKKRRAAENPKKDEGKNPGDGQKQAEGTETK
ncbi:MAG: hypothetical protein ACI4Q3_09970 [Kiritimatiellia bacterium]